MIAPGDSLMTRAASQLSLFTSATLPDEMFYADEHPTDGRNPTFTAARLFKFRPETYAMVVQLRAESMSANTVAEVCKVSAKTVAAVDARESQSAIVAELKAGATKRFRRLQRLSLERLEEMLLSGDKIPARDLAIIAGICTDGANKESGEPDLRIRVESEAGQDDLVNELARLRRAYEARMGLEAGAGAAKEAGPGAGARAAAIEVVDVEVHSAAGAPDTAPTDGQAQGCS